jgi:hypothetical protein
MMFGVLLFLLMVVVEALRRRLIVGDRGLFWSLCRTRVGEEKENKEGREDQPQLHVVSGHDEKNVSGSRHRYHNQSSRDHNHL